MLCNAPLGMQADDRFSGHSLVQSFLTAQGMSNLLSQVRSCGNLNT